MSMSSIPTIRTLAWDLVEPEIEVRDLTRELMPVERHELRQLRGQ